MPLAIIHCLHGFILIAIKRIATRFLFELTITISPHSEVIGKHQHLIQMLALEQNWPQVPLPPF